MTHYKTRLSSRVFFCFKHSAGKIPYSGEGAGGGLEPPCNMDLKRLSDLVASERGTLTRIDAPEGMLALMEMGCIVGEDIEDQAHRPAGRTPWLFQPADTS